MLSKCSENFLLTLSLLTSTVLLDSTPCSMMKSLVILIGAFSTLVCCVTASCKIDVMKNASLLNNEESDFLLIDFRSTLPIEEILKKFEPVQDKIVYQFKIYGMSRYIFVLHNDESEELKTLYLPSNDTLTQEVVPVQWVSKFFKLFDIRSTVLEPNITTMWDKDLMLVERTIDLEGLTHEELKAILSYHADYLSKSLPDKQIFVPTAYLPLKFYFIVNHNSTEAVNMHLGSSNSLGGPGKVDIKTYRIANLPINATETCW